MIWEVINCCPNDMFFNFLASQQKVKIKKPLCDLCDSSNAGGEPVKIILGSVKKKSGPWNHKPGATALTALTTRSE